MHTIIMKFFFYTDAPWGIVASVLVSNDVAAPDGNSDSSVDSTDFKRLVSNRIPPAREWQSIRPISFADVTQ